MNLNENCLSTNLSYPSQMVHKHKIQPIAHDQTKEIEFIVIDDDDQQDNNYEYDNHKNDNNIEYDLNNAYQDSISYVSNSKINTLNSSQPRYKSSLSNRQLHKGYKKKSFQISSNRINKILSNKNDNLKDFIKPLELRIDKLEMSDIYRFYEVRKIENF